MGLMIALTGITSASAQGNYESTTVKVEYVPLEKNKPIAPGTILTDISVKSTKIVTSNDSVAKSVSSCGSCFSSFSQRTKKDRNGYYIEYTFTFPREKRNTILNIVKNQQP